MSRKSATAPIITKDSSGAFVTALTERKRAQVTVVGDVNRQTEPSHTILSPTTPIPKLSIPSSQVEEPTEGRPRSASKNASSNDLLSPQGANGTQVQSPTKPQKPRRTSAVPAQPINWNGNVKHLIKVQSVVRRHLVIKKLDKNIKKRKLLVEEIRDTEDTYVNILRILLRFYERPLRARLGRENALLSESQIDLIFAEIANLLDCHEVLLKLLKTKAEKWSRFVKVSETFFVVSDAMRNCYQVFASQYEDAIDVLRETKHNSAAFAAFLHDAVIASGSKLDINDLLITPIQRFPRYILLLERLRDYIDDWHPEHSFIEEIIRRVRNVAEFMNHRRAEAEKRIQVRLIQKSIKNCPIQLLIPGRYFAQEMPVTVLNEANERALRQLVVFNDSLMCVKITRASIPFKTNSPNKLLTSASLPNFSTSPEKNSHKASLPAPTVLAPMNSSQPVLEFEWLFLLSQIAISIMNEPVKGQNFVDPIPVYEELKRVEKLVENDALMQESARKIKNLYTGQNATVAEWAKVELEDMQRSSSGLSRQLEELRALYQISHAQVGLQIIVNSGSEQGKSVIVAVDDLAMRESLLATIRALNKDVQQSTLRKSQSNQTDAKVLLWHVGSTVNFASRISPSVSSSVAFVSVPIITRVNKLTFSIGKPDMKKLLDIGHSSFMKRAQSILRSTPSNAPRQAALSIRWTADVVAVTEKSRSVVRLCLLNHALVCGCLLPSSSLDKGSKISEDQNEYRLEWMCPVVSLSMQTCEIPSTWHDPTARQTSDIMREMIEVQKEIERQNQLLAGIKKIAAAAHAGHSLTRAKSDAQVRVKLTEDDILKTINSLKEKTATLRRLLSLSDSRLGVKIQVNQTSTTYYVAMDNAEVRDLLLLRFQSVRVASIQRLSNTLYRASRAMATQTKVRVQEPSDDDASSSSSIEKIHEPQESVRKSREVARRSMHVDTKPVEDQSAELLDRIREEVQAVFDDYLACTARNDWSTYESQTEIFIGKCDHLAETEDELMFLAGERIHVLKRMTSQCWMCGCQGVVGTLDPTHLLNLSEAGLTEVPSFQRSSDTASVHLALADHRNENFLDALFFYEGEEVLIVARDLSHPYLALGVCQNVIGWTDPRYLGKEIPK